MKKQHRLISFILVLSLIFSSLIFTTSAAEESSSSGNDLTQTDFFEPTATYTKLTASNKATLLAKMKASWSEGSGTDANIYLLGDPDLETYFVAGAEEGNTNEYLMVLPSETAAENGQTKNHAYFSSYIQSYVTYGKNEYYVFEVDIATESSYLPLSFMVNSRYDTDGDGTTDPFAGTTFYPKNCSALLNITPGIFHHLTLVAHPDTNKLYVYLDDTKVATVENGVMTDTIYENTYKKGYPVYIQDMRIQRDSLTYNMSICLDNFSNRIFTADSTNDGDISKYAGTDSLDGWADNKISLSSKGTALPSLITVNGVSYNNTVDASAALDTYKLGNTAEMLRSCYSASITVNCDAVIKTSLAEVDLVAGEDVTLTKGNGSTWISRFKNVKYSASTELIGTKYHDITSYVKYLSDDNLITSVNQTNAVNPKDFSETEYENLTADQKKYLIAGTTDGDTIYSLTSDVINGASLIYSVTDGNGAVSYKLLEKASDVKTDGQIDAEKLKTQTGESTAQAVPFDSTVFSGFSIAGYVTTTDNGNEYFVMRDATEDTGDFPLNVHYQVNANTQSTPALGDHEFVVFEQDIYSESSYIDIYAGFNLRTPNNDALSAKTIYVSKLSVSPGKWYHLTFVGEVSTGNSYVFVDGVCVALIEGGLWDETSIARMRTYYGDETATVEKCIEGMLLGSFRTMQIAGEYNQAKNLTYDMSAASDNYYLRWVDEESADSLSEIINSIKEDYNSVPEGSETPDKTLDNSYHLTAWTGNIFTDDYEENVLPELAVLATINGVEYFDTTGINNILGDEDYTTPLQEVVIYREYIGTINVNCRAAVTLNGVTSKLTYTDKVIRASENSNVFYKQTPNDDGNTYYPIACVDGVLYYDDGAKNSEGTEYTNNKTALIDLLASNTSEIEYTVTFLRAISESVTVNANAILDFNGLSIDVEIDEAVCAIIVGTHTTKVVNLKTTLYLATMNGADYKNDADGLAALQAAITAADEVELQLYHVPDVPLKISCPAKIDTNGLVTGDTTVEQLITTDFYSFDISSQDGGSYDYEITSAGDRYATIQVIIAANDESTFTHNVTARLGDDIAEVLTENGLMNNVLVAENDDGNTVVYITEWTASPSGVVSRENENESTPAYVFTAKVTSSTVIESYYACVSTNGTITQSSDASTAQSWFPGSDYNTIILNADLSLGNTTISGSNKNIYLNGHTINNTAQNAHGFLVSGASVNFYGEGTLNYLDNPMTQALFYTNCGYTGKITVNNVTVNTYSYALILRDGSMEFNNCTINGYTQRAATLFSLGEEYNTSVSKVGINLTLKDCDVTYRYYNVTDYYTGYTTNNPLITNKTVNLNNAGDVDRTIIIDGCTIKSQGSLIQANTGTNALTASKLKLYVNDTDLVAKSIIKGDIKPGSVYFCDDVRTNVESLDNITIAADLIKAQTSDGIYKVLYTSHDYATITWSDGETEFWANGSTPVNKNCLFDEVTADGVTEGENTVYTSSGTGFPFKLYMNLTLTTQIGFNIYVPVSVVGDDPSLVQVYMDGKLISPNTYANDSSTVRKSIVAVAGGYCYDYTLTLAPQDAAKSFTLVIIYNGQYVSRKVSVADYAEKLCENGLTERTKALLQVTLAYIEQAAMYAGNTVDMSRISALRTSTYLTGYTESEPAAPTAPNVTHSEEVANFGTTEEGALGYIESTQINFMDTCAIRFNLTSSSYTGFTFYVANDKNDGYELRQHTVAADGSYLELELKAFELARSIKIVYDGNYQLYSLYNIYDNMSSPASETVTISGTSYSTGAAWEYKAAQKLIKILYTYASTCDKYYDSNAAEYNPSTTN